MSNLLLEMASLPYALYRAEQVRALDRYVIKEHGIPGSLLMERAGSAAWQVAKKHWPTAKDITIVCGIGNNGGDGYVLARLALADGCTVRVLQLGDSARLSGDALTMAQQYQVSGGIVQTFQELPTHTDLVVDAILGTGLEREVQGEWAVALKTMNQHYAPILALDIPSGLNSDSGRIMGCAIQAQLTVSFVALKQGLFTGQGPDYCGEIHFAGLEIPAQAYQQEIPSARRIDWSHLAATLKPRRRTAHKGEFGHVLLIGGAPGMSGALRLAGEAAARCGAGLVTMATYPGQGNLLNLTRPELMCYELNTPTDLDPLLARATVVVVGPGLGQSDWARGLFKRLLRIQQPLIIDADALNLLATTPINCRSWVLTPHPGEAARLLGWPKDRIQHDRFAAINALGERYGGTIALKGAGTLVRGNSNRPLALCSNGNPGMASGGMGDLLTGLIAGFIAQGFESEDATCMGVCLHSAAGDLAAQEGERGLLPSDLFPSLRVLLNPKTIQC